MKRATVPYRISFVGGERDYYGHFDGAFKNVIHQIPVNAVRLSCEYQFDFERFGPAHQIAVYFLIDPDESRTEGHEFRVVASGEEFDLREGETFVGHIPMNYGEHMFHVYHRVLVPEAVVGD